MNSGDLFSANGIDLSLRHRAPKTEDEVIKAKVILSVDEFCLGYEDRIAAIGGIGAIVFRF